MEYLSFTGKAVIEPQDLPPTFPLSWQRAAKKEKEEAVPALLEPSEQSEKGESQEYWYVPGQMYQASEEGQFIGREAILKNARESYLPLPQKEVRDILEQMTAEGLAKVSKGRGGSRITPLGRRKWEERGASTKGKH